MSLNNDYVINKRCFEGCCWRDCLSIAYLRYNCVQPFTGMSFLLSWKSQPFNGASICKQLLQHHKVSKRSTIIERDILFYFRPQWYMMIGCG